MRILASCLLALSLSACCTTDAVLTLVETEIGAQERDLVDWGKLSDTQQKESAQQSLDAMKEIKWRLTGRN